MNIRDFLSQDESYFQFNREERNIAALLYHLLFVGANLKRFYDLIGCECPVNSADSEVYFEYAYLRDVWNAKVKDDSDLARRLILEFLDPPNRTKLETCSMFEFNVFFGAVPKASKTAIQSPGNWSISLFKNTIPNNDFFLKVCKFKWAFNIKPDLVVIPSKENAVCIEAKFASGEGSYPSNAKEKTVFDLRGLPRIGQTEVQRYLFEDLLGYETTFVFLVQNAKAKSKTHTTLTWAEVFRELDTTSSPPFVRKWLEQFDEN